MTKASIQKAYNGITLILYDNHSEIRVQMSYKEFSQLLKEGYNTLPSYHKPILDS